MKTNELIVIARDALQAGTLPASFSKTVQDAATMPSARRYLQAILVEYRLLPTVGDNREAEYREAEYRAERMAERMAEDTCTGFGLDY